MENTPLPLFKKRRAKDIQKQYDCFNAKMFSFTQMGIKIFLSVKSLDRSGQSMNTSCSTHVLSLVSMMVLLQLLHNIGSGGSS